MRKDCDCHFHHTMDIPKPAEILRLERVVAKERARAEAIGPLAPAIEFLANDCARLIVRMSEFASLATSASPRSSDVEALRSLGGKLVKVGSVFLDSSIEMWQSSRAYPRERQRVLKVDGTLSSIRAIGLKLAQAGEAARRVGECENHSGAAVLVRESASCLLDAANIWNSVMEG